MYRALVFAALALTSYAVPQAVTSVIEPSGTAPAGCQPTYSGKFCVSMEVIAVKSESMMRTGNEEISGEKVSNKAADTNELAVVAWSDDGESFQNRHATYNSLTTRTTENLEAAGNVSASADMSNCVNATDGTLLMTLDGGVMHDSLGRTAYIASNYQWQFDAPPQAGAISTGGYSVCSNNSLALGGSAVWFECKSGGFFNIYPQYLGAQCLMATMDVVPVCGA